MKYVGLQGQIWKNNIKSTVLLILFPVIIFVLVWLFLFLTIEQPEQRIDYTNLTFIRTIPWVSIGVLIWFLVAFFNHSRMIQKATGSSPLERSRNKRVYNIVENLCISIGMKTPKIYIIDDDSLNAFASGINESTYSVSLSRGIIDKLDDAELEGVVAHELTHIKNRDVRLLIVSIIFVGIFAFITEALLRSVRYSGNSKGKKDGRIILIALLLAAIGYLLSSIFRFALSKKREYMADAGAAQITKNPLALATALEKVSSDSRIEAVTRKDIAQLFIDNPGEKKESSLKSSFTSIFATHPPIEKRIEILKQF